MRTNKNGVNKDQKDKVKKDGYNRGQHCVYCLTYHMIFVTHYRKPVINDEMSRYSPFPSLRYRTTRNWWSRCLRSRVAVTIVLKWSMKTLSVQKPSTN